MKKHPNQLISYLAVTAGVGCAATVAEGAIVVVDLSGLSTSITTVMFPATNGDSQIDIYFASAKNDVGYLINLSGSSFYGDVAGIIGIDNFARGYQRGATANFPSDPDTSVIWNFVGNIDGGFIVGENWVAFKDTAGRYGWLSFTLNSLGVNNTIPISSYGSFVYDPASTSPATAITLQAAVAAVAAVPEPSGLVLLALGATGLAARRQRRKAA